MGYKAVTGCGGDRVDAFASLNHFKQLLAELEAAVAAGKAKNVAVDPSKRWGSAWRERWLEWRGHQGALRHRSPGRPNPGGFGFNLNRAALSRMLPSTPHHRAELLRKYPL